MSNETVSFFPLTHDIETLLDFTELLTVQVGDIGTYKEDSKKLRRITDNIRINKNYAPNEKEIVVVPPDADIEKLLRYPIPILKAHEEERQILLSQRHAVKLGISGSHVKKIEKLPESFTFQKDYRKLFEFPVPVFGVLGTEESCGKFRLQLSLKKYFDDHSIKTAFVCSNHLGALSGMYTIPEELFGNTYTFSEKVSYLNQYLSNIYFEMKPDMIVLGVPGGVFSLQDNENDYYSEFAHVFSHVLKFDAVSLNLFRNEERTDEILDAIDSYMAYIFTTSVYMYGVSSMIAKRINDSDEYEMLDTHSYVTEKQPCVRRETGSWIVDTGDMRGIYCVLDHMVDEMQDGIHSL
ncbi:MAG: hypothetical protein IJJ34_10810 [Clostridia bacterium]|nr:hypothetical protein [Clostridia bacterium]